MVDEKQQYHFFASTAFGWASAKTRAYAIEKVAKETGPKIIRGNVTSNGGVYVWTCKVYLPQSARYTINNYAPEFPIDSTGAIDRENPVDFDSAIEYMIQNTLGLVRPKD